MSTTTPSVFVLVHGAWHGGWCWSRVAHHLQAMGHKVYTPTLTGLGERQHLLSPDITLSTFVQDIANVLKYENLEQVVLVGHSFGGLAISGVADIMPERIKQLIYLDAFILESGITTFDTLPDDVVEMLRTTAKQLPVPALHPPRPKVLGLTEADDIAYIDGRLTPHPLSAYESSLELNHPVGNGLPCTYVHCTNPVFSAVADSAVWAKARPGWHWEELDSSHAAIVSEPLKVAQLLCSQLH